jgi:phenolic acid decarboxylase
METVKELEAKLALVRKKEEKDNWEKYLNETENYLKSLVGKTFIKHYSNGGFCMFKVSNYHTQYYADRNGFSGQWFPSRWFELESTAMINCRVADNKGQWFRGGISYNEMKFKVLRGKAKDSVEVSKLDLVDFEKEKYTYLPSEIREFGKMSYENGKPNFERDKSDFSVFLREAPEGMWEEAKRIADQNLKETELFWSKYQPIVNKL